MIVLVGVVLATAIQLNHRTSMEVAMGLFRSDADRQARRIAVDVERVFHRTYRSLRTIGRLPGIRALDAESGSPGSRGGDALERNCRLAIQEIYNDLALDVAVSEIYVVPVDLDPDYSDLEADHRAEPWITFDELILNRHADEDLDSATAEAIGLAGLLAELEEVEIHEYLEMKRQLIWLQEYHAREGTISGLDYPALVSPPVVTCDNTYYSPSSPRNRDRTGIVYTVPFYGPDGELTGCVSAVILLRALQDLVPGGAHALRNVASDLLVDSLEARQFRKSEAYIRDGVPDPGLPYSSVARLDIPDREGDWRLWSGWSATAFQRRADVRAAQAFLLLAHLANLLLAGCLVVVTVLARRNRRLSPVATQNYTRTRKRPSPAHLRR